MSPRLLPLLFIASVATASCAAQPIRPAAVQALPAGEQTAWGDPEAMSLYMEAIALKGAGDLEGAVAVAEQAAAADPESAALKVLVAEIYFAMRRTEEALSWAGEALRVEPANQEALKISARVHSTKQEFDRAAEAYRSIIANDPEDKEAYLHLGGILLDRGKTEEAREVFTALLAVDPLNHLALHFLGRIHLERNELAEARDRFAQAVERQPGFIAAWNMLGVVRERLHDLSGAADAYGRVVERDPHNLSVLKRLAVIELDLGRDDSATKRLQMILARDPRDLSSRLSLGLLYSRKEDYPKALQEMKAAREIAGDNVGIELSIVDLLFEMGENNAAAEELARLLAKYPANPEVVGRAASQHRLRKEYAEAVALLTGLIGGEDDQPHLRAQILGDVPGVGPTRRGEEVRGGVADAIRRGPHHPVRTRHRQRPAP